MEKPMKYLARVNPKYFAAIHQCAAKGDVRYYLNAVHIEPHVAGGVVIVATNGHFMGAMHDPDGWIHPDHKSVLIGTVSKRMQSACMSRKGPDGEPPAVLWISEKFSLVSSFPDTTEEPELFGQFSHLTEKTELVDGKFPDWRRVMPKQRAQFEGAYPCLNGEYLEAFNKIGVMLSGQKHFGGGGMHLETGSDKGSVVVRFNSHDLVDRFVGILMPMRGEEMKAFLPAWAEVETASEAA
jgi:DNA polymerase-3 subunit beta